MLSLPVVSGTLAVHGYIKKIKKMSNEFMVGKEDTFIIENY